ncbi:di-heme oxidoredictase family protein [Sedimentitalea sp. JM2-8]|uniref:Di-heme oxidoredictase family protein n=1 Tax=Sedimentitalea xiamensis TaxID=3050037 RepID=A0ABT7FHI2_9RHOB|nr:di-heme oxidoredictase family protein [Sedimentitalea xiamensis]MDK3074596.1 di-heme oxidoredictase family protein [Sedimentitalea xiamensis]
MAGHPRPMAGLIAALGLAGLALPGHAGGKVDLTRPHLEVVARTAAESGRIAAVTAPAADFSAPEPFEANAGGAATVRARDNTDAFSQPSANMPFERELDFKVGNGLFRKLWVSSPSSTLVSDGLGPLFNARGCQNCHLKDGRGHPPESPDDDAVSMFLRISVPATAAAGTTEIEAFLLSLGDETPRTAPDPVYGGQLQDFAIQGHDAEYRLDIAYEEIEVPLSGGETASLRKPRYRAADLGYGPLGPDAMLSPRVAPQMIGLGLLEAIDAQDILAREDPADADGDGVSGRAQIVWSFEHARPMLGRFGLKAGSPTIREQSASAFAGDIGISSPVFGAGWGDCTEFQTTCRTAPDGSSGTPENTEIGAEGLDLVTFYARNLAVPERRDVGDTQVLRGKEIFYGVGCPACHTPKYVTSRLADQPEQSFQLIWPYTDLLLHDMGPGLADNRPEGRADGREWRTPPLWGIGLTETVSGHSYFLHDGRARSLLEAVLWHGGEARAQRDAVVDMPPEDRAALIRYLESL